MKLAVVLYVCLSVCDVFSHMPTVYEFCSHVVANGDAGRAVCDASQCQGRPGKIGPAGPRGIPGVKGDKGEQRPSVGLEEKVENLEESIEALEKLFLHVPETKEILCYMGMKNNDIADSALSASSSSDDNQAPRYGRLDFQPSYPPAGAWQTRQRRVGEWYQVDFGKSESVAGLITQGRYDLDRWVTSFKVQCGNSTGKLETITDQGIEKVFTGNADRNTKVVNKFPKPMICRYVRVYPQSWNKFIAIRMEFIRGKCYEFY